MSIILLNLLYISYCMYPTCNFQAYNCVIAKKQEMARHKKLCTVFYSFLWHTDSFKKRGNQLIRCKVACLNFAKICYENEMNPSVTARVKTSQILFKLAKVHLVH